MRTDNKIAREHNLTPVQHFFCECWFNLVHEASLDAYRVRSMNPRNIVRELLEISHFEHANEGDVGRVAAEAIEILSNVTILGDSVFQPAASELVGLLMPAGARPAGRATAYDEQAIKAIGGSVKKNLSLVDAFGRELSRTLQEQFITLSLSWLREKLNFPEQHALTPEQYEKLLIEVETVVGNLLSALIDDGWSFESLFMLYRLMLLPAIETRGAANGYDFFRQLDTVFQRLRAAPKPYRITFAISNVSKPALFPPKIGEIEFKVDAPKIPTTSSNYVRRYASKVGGRLFATIEVQAQDGRLAGTIAGDQIGRVLDVVRYDYERKNLQLSHSFLVEKSDNVMLLQLPGTVPNPDSSLSAPQLEEFMSRLNNLVDSGALTSDGKERIYSAFRLYRIGAETYNFENKLVNWWTAVEFLVKGGSGGSIGDGVEKALAPTIAMAYLPKHLDVLRSILISLKIEIKSANGDDIELSNLGHVEFFDLIREPIARTAIENICAARPFILHRIKRLLSVVTNDAHISAALVDHERRLRWQIQRIYRARCDIVHSAHRVVNATLLCANLEFYLKTVLTAFLDALHRHPTLRSPKEFFERQQYFIGKMNAELAGNKHLLLAQTLKQRDGVH